MVKPSTFDVFWAQYPCKVAKLKAMKAYATACTRATTEQILDGVERYKRTKPAWQAWAYPTSWLNAGRWLDEVDVPVSKKYGPSARDLELIAEYERAKREKI